MPAPTLTPRPLKRKGYWYFARRVPVALVALDSRTYVFQSTGIRITDDPRGISAQKIVNQLELQIQSYWRSLRSGAKPDHSKLEFQRVYAHAGELGHTYIPAAEVAALKPVDLLDRVQLIDQPATIEDPLAVSTFLGGEKRPAILLSKMRETYEEIVATSLRQKSDRQRQRWRTTRDFAVTNFIDTIGGDRAITGLTRQHVLTFRNKWQSRIAMDEVEVDTANKSIGYVGTMFRAINDTHMLGFPFGRVFTWA